MYLFFRNELPGSVKYLSFFANDDFKTNDNLQMLTMSQGKRINAIMLTCGFYNESGEIAFKIGLPDKSGVGGGIVAIHPNKYFIAVWSPRLNEKGNSHRGMKFLELFTTKKQSSIFFIVTIFYKWFLFHR